MTLIDEVQALVNKAGYDCVMEAVKEAGSNVRDLEEACNVGNRYNGLFRFFTKDDWMGFGGAMRWPDGVRPMVYYEFPFVMDCKDENRQVVGLEWGKSYQVICLVCWDEKSPTGTQISLIGDDGVLLSKNFRTRELALGLLDVLAEIKVIRFSHLLSLGFQME